MGTHGLDILSSVSFCSVQRVSLAESNNRLARILTDQCLKFSDDTPSVAMPPHWIIYRI